MGVCRPAGRQATKLAVIIKWKKCYEDKEYPGQIPLLGSQAQIPVTVWVHGVSSTSSSRGDFGPVRPGLSGEARSPERLRGAQASQNRETRNAQNARGTRSQPDLMLDWCLLAYLLQQGTHYHSRTRKTGECNFFLNKPAIVCV